jgi:hypothetical protein
MKGEPMLDLHITKGEHLEVEVSPELGLPGYRKLYVHLNGVTVLRVCKIAPDQLEMKIAQ